jgi:hypothetical protein
MRESQEQEIHLTPTQADIFLPGGPELVTCLQKLLNHDKRVLAEFKIQTWAYKNGALPADNYLRNFVHLCTTKNPSKKKETLIIDMGSAWQRYLLQFNG